MRQTLRFGCLGVVIMLIAAFSTIGVYALVAGAITWNGAGARTVSAGAPVLVTIQAVQMTPTPASAASTTPGPAALLAGALPPVHAAPAPAAVTSTTVPVASGPAPVLQTPAPSPAVLAAQPGGAPSITDSIPAPQAAQLSSTQATVPAAPPMQPAAASQPPSAAHDGLKLEVVEVERGWQALAPDGSPLVPRDGWQTITVHVRLASSVTDLRYVADGDLLLVSADGARFTPRQGAGLREPRLPTLPLPAGDSVRGWLTYEVPAGAAIGRLQWSPTRPDRPRADVTYALALP